MLDTTTNTPASLHISDAEMLHSVSRHVGVTISVFDRSLTFRYISDRFAEWFGKTADEVVGRTLMENYGEHNFTQSRPYLERVLAGEIVTYDRLVRDPFGPDAWRTVSLVPWRDVDGKVVGVVHSALSVNELKTKTEALHLANQRLQSHMDNSPLAVIEFDENLAVARWSPHVCACPQQRRDHLL